MYEQHESNHGLSLASVLVGVAAGIAGTIIYAAYREREFNRVVSKTREMGDRSTEYIGNVGGNIKEKANAVVDTVKEKAVSVVDSAEAAVSNISKSVHDIADKHPKALN